MRSYVKVGVDDLNVKDLFVNLGLLIVESRIPDATRGKLEGSHCALITSARSCVHACDASSPECSRVQRIASQLGYLWEQKIAANLYVVLEPQQRCVCGSVGDAIILEKWLIQNLENHSKHEQVMHCRFLVQAVHSYLYFSQLSSWLDKSNGAFPYKIIYRIGMPGESGKEEISMRFAEFYEKRMFPSCDTLKGSVMTVKLESLRRLETLPMYECLCSKPSSSDCLMDVPSAMLEAKDRNGRSPFGDDDARRRTGSSADSSSKNKMFSPPSFVQSGVLPTPHREKSPPATAAGQRSSWQNLFFELMMEMESASARPELRCIHGKHRRSTSNSVPASGLTPASLASYPCARAFALNARLAITPPPPPPPTTALAALDGVHFFLPSDNDDEDGVAANDDATPPKKVPPPKVPRQGSLPGARRNLSDAFRGAQLASGQTTFAIAKDGTCEVSGTIAEIASPVAPVVATTSATTNPAVILTKSGATSENVPPPRQMPNVLAVPAWPGSCTSIINRKSSRNRGVYARSFLGPKFNPITGLPLCSSPVPVRKNHCSLDSECTLNSVDSIKNALSCDYESASSDSDSGYPTCKSVPERMNLLGSFEGHCSLEQLGKRGYHIPARGNVQLTVFNPQGSVVKMFIVQYNLSDMPPRCQTFVRQRSFFMPCKATRDDVMAHRSWLRYLIHLRFFSSRSRKVYLHSDIRMLFARKSELDAFNLNSVSGRSVECGQDGESYDLRSFTEVPENPRYSPRK